MQVVIMAHIGISYVVSTAFILTVGFSGCRAADCSIENIYESCLFVNNNDCEFWRKEVECLERIDNSTCNAELLGELAQTLAYKRGRAAECPGLEDGICYFNAMRPCDEGVPYKLIYYRDLSEDQKREYCKPIKGQEDDRKACSEALKPKCVAENIQAIFKRHQNKMDAIKEICAKYTY